MNKHIDELTDEQKNMLQRIADATETGGLSRSDLDDEEQQLLDALADKRLIELDEEDDSTLPPYEARGAWWIINDAGRAVLDDSDD